MHVRLWILIATATCCLMQPSCAAVEIDHIARAIHLERQGDCAAALAEYAAALKANPNDVVALIDRSNLRIDMGDQNGALQDINRVLQLNPIDPDALCLKADIEASEGDYKNALADYDKAIKWKRINDSSMYTNRGIMQMKRGENELALHDFETAIAINNDLTAQFNRMRLLNDKAAIKAAYDRINKVVPKNASDHLILANAHSVYGDSVKALKELDIALSKNHALFTARFNRAVLRAESGDKPGALLDYDEYIRLNKTNPKAYYNRGLLREKLNDRQGSMEDLKHALELDPHLKLNETSPTPFSIVLG